MRRKKSMKKVRMVLLVLAAVLAVAGLAAAAHHEASVDKGKALFNDPKLGTTGKSCNDCHQNGKGIEKAAGKKDLVSIVNMCITRGLKGKALDATSMDMQSLVMYINSFGNQKKETKKTAPVGC
jgi:cytochrome c peroxidase